MSYNLTVSPVQVQLNQTPENMQAHSNLIVVIKLGNQVKRTQTVPAQNKLDAVWQDEIRLNRTTEEILEVRLSAMETPQSSQGQLLGVATIPITLIQQQQLIHDWFPLLIKGDNEAGFILVKINYDPNSQGASYPQQPQSLPQQHPHQQVIYQQSQPAGYSQQQAHLIEPQQPASSAHYYHQQDPRQPSPISTATKSYLQSPSAQAYQSTPPQQAYQPQTPQGYAQLPPHIQQQIQQQQQQDEHRQLSQQNQGQLPAGYQVVQYSQAPPTGPAQYLQQGGAQVIQSQQAISQGGFAQQYLQQQQQQSQLQPQQYLQYSTQPPQPQYITYVNESPHEQSSYIQTLPQQQPRYTQAFHPQQQINFPQSPPNVMRPYDMVNCPQLSSAHPSSIQRSPYNIIQAPQQFYPSVQQHQGVQYVDEMQALGQAFENQLYVQQPPPSNPRIISSHEQGYQYQTPISQSALRVIPQSIAYEGVSSPQRIVMTPQQQQLHPQQQQALSNSQLRLVSYQPQPNSQQVHYQASAMPSGQTLSSSQIRLVSLQQQHPQAGQQIMYADQPLSYHPGQQQQQLQQQPQYVMYQ